MKQSFRQGFASVNQEGTDGPVDSAAPTGQSSALRSLQVHISSCLFFVHFFMYLFFLDEFNLNDLLHLLAAYHSMIYVLQQPGSPSLPRQAHGFYLKANLQYLTNIL
jgi:hypothetical protein